MLIFAYIYYRKFFANRKGLTEEEIEEQERLEQEKLRLENEREWEERRFAKMRYCGQSEFYSWQLIKKVKIIEGMSQDIKVVQKKEPEPKEPENTEDVEQSSRGQNRNAIQVEDQNGGIAEDSIDKIIGSDTEKQHTNGLNTVPQTAHKNNSDMNLEQSTNSKLPVLKQQRSKNTTTNSAAKESTVIEYELKPTDTKVDVFYVNAQRQSKTPGMNDLELSRKRLQQMDRDEEAARNSQDPRYMTGGKRTHPSEANTQARSTNKSDKEGEEFKKSSEQNLNQLQDETGTRLKYRRLSTQSLENRKYLRQRATVSHPLIKNKI